MLVRLSDDDHSQIKAGAAREGLAVGAWLRELAVRSAGGAGWDLAVSRRDVLGQLVRVRADVAHILTADDSTEARPLVIAALLRLDTLIGRASQESAG